MQAPWYRKTTGCWYVTLGRKQINLGKDPHGAGRKHPPKAILE